MKESRKDMLSYVIIALVAIMLVFTVVQTFQIEAIKKEVKPIGYAKTTNVQKSLITAKPPTMVGGC